jgi:uncharacterized membrane protein
MSSPQAGASVPVFEALIVPYRSMSRRGIVLTACALLTLSLAIALRFLLLGAWPVMIFSLLEVPLVTVLLALNLRQARASELIVLDHHAITVTSTDPAGRRQNFSLPAAWLQVSLQASRGGSSVILSSRGRGREIGAFLHEPDKASLFEALQSAMNDVRHPRFDNAQLREPKAQPDPST